MRDVHYFGLQIEIYPKVSRWDGIHGILHGLIEPHIDMQVIALADWRGVSDNVVFKNGVDKNGRPVILNGLL